MSQRKRQKSYYYQKCTKKKRTFCLEPGLRGFICTCNNREKECVRESYSILDEYAVLLYGEEGAEKNASEAQCTNEEDDGDTDVAMCKEVGLLKEMGKGSELRRFQIVETGAKNCLFIQTTIPDPVALAHYIMKDIDHTKQQKGRFIIRMIPVEKTCKVYMEDIKKAAGDLFDKYFSVEGKSFCVVFNRHSSSALDRDELIEELAYMIKLRHACNRVDLKQPQLTVLVELVRSVCCLSILPDYMKYHKYNLHKLSCARQEEAAVSDQMVVAPDEAKSSTKLEDDEGTRECIADGNKAEVNTKEGEQREGSPRD